MPNTIAGIKRLALMMAVSVLAALLVSVVDGWEHFLAMFTAAAVCSLLLDMIDALIALREIGLADQRWRDAMLEELSK